ncbi:hypothetical protein PENSPDRAFT_659371 [Peniophora sp. CONT]|nr:hypothetical protein PENSPDRAFT_659371 [Peniophora sp. CONT]
MTYSRLSLTIFSLSRHTEQRYINNKILKTYLIVHGVSVAFDESEVNEAREEVTMARDQLFEYWHEDFPSHVIRANKEHFDYEQFPVRFTTFQWLSIHAVHLPALIDVIVTVECRERWLEGKKAQESGSDEAFGQPFMAVFNEESALDDDEHDEHDEHGGKVAVEGEVSDDRKAENEGVGVASQYRVRVPFIKKTAE